MAYEIQQPWVPRGEHHELSERPTRELVREFVDQGVRLIREEARLAKVEIEEKAKTVARSSGAIGAGGAVLLGGFLALVCCAVALLSLAMPVWVAALIVGAILCIVGTVMVKGGLSRMKHIKPERTLRTLKEDREWATDMKQRIRSRTPASE